MKTSNPGPDFSVEAERFMKLMAVDAAAMRQKYESLDVSDSDWKLVDEYGEATESLVDALHLMLRARGDILTVADRARPIH